MKLYKKLFFCLATCISCISCTDWLDTNVNPNTPTAESALYQNRLPWCQFYLNQGYMIVASNTTYYCGQLASPTGSQQLGATKWALNSSNRANNAQQWFLVPCASNLADMYEKATKAGAWHYAAAAKFMRAYGFMEMTDLFGELPYTEALGESVAPKYDTGKTIFMGCIAELEEAIELFQKEQTEGAVPLSVGDSWNDGDVNKWLKMCYLLKARWLNHLSKKQAGSYKDGKYDTAEILACLNKAHQSNTDNTVIRHTDTNSSTHDVEGWGETVDFSSLFSTVGMNNNRYYVTKAFYDNLTNFGGYGVEDPRADKFIPWVRSKKSSVTPIGIKWSADGTWRRSLGVDLQSNILSNSGPFAISFNATTNSWYCNTKTVERLGDTIYVQGRSGSKGYNSFKDMLYRYSVSNDASAISGAFHVRPSSPTVVASYAEACFIKAEILFRQNNKKEAYDAYKAGVKANIDFVNEQLNTWVAEDATLEKCPSFTPMTQVDIDKFLNEGIGTANDITLGKIMTQKQTAMLYTVEQWNDMRRLDYNKDYFLNWDKPYEYKTTPTYWTYVPQDKYPRRWKQSSYETDYNFVNLNAIGSEVPGALDLPLGKGEGAAWYNSDQIWTLPVWWDSDQE